MLHLQFINISLCVILIWYAPFFQRNLIAKFLEIFNFIRIQQFQFNAVCIQARKLNEIISSTHNEELSKTKNDWPFFTELTYKYTDNERRLNSQSEYLNVVNIQWLSFKIFSIFVFPNSKQIFYQNSELQTVTNNLIYHIFCVICHRTW